MKRSILTFICLIMTVMFSMSAQAVTYKITVEGKTTRVRCAGKRDDPGESGQKCRQDIYKATRALRREKQEGSDKGFFARASEQVRKDFSEAGQKIKSDAQKVGSAISGAGKAVVRVTKEGWNKVTGQTYRVKIPRREHTMTYHCFGGEESKECKEERAEVVKALESGASEPSLRAYRMREVTVVTDKVGNTFKKINHDFCRKKLAQFAGEFDEEYQQKFATGQQTGLVSYVEKIEYMKAELIKIDRLDMCIEHLVSASMGHQLDWISDLGAVKNDTHIFDGLGRVSEKSMGYWKNEKRNKNYSESLKRSRGQ